MTDINDQMIIESNDIVGYSDYYTYTDFSENENLDSVINSIGSYICSDIDNEEPFLKNLLNKYDTNLDNLFNNTTIQSIKELSDNFVEKDNYIKKKAEEIENNFNIFTNISSDIDKIKNIFRVNLENMVHIEKELKELIDKYKKNKKVILDVRNTYKDEDNETLKQFEEIFDKMNNNYIKNNNIEYKINSYIDYGIKLNVILKVILDIKSLISFNITFNLIP